MGLEGMQRGIVQHSGSSLVTRASTVRQQGLMCSRCAQDMTFAAYDKCAVDLLGGRVNGNQQCSNAAQHQMRAILAC